MKVLKLIDLIVGAFLDLFRRLVGDANSLGETLLGLSGDLVPVLLMFAILALFFASGETKPVKDVVVKTRISSQHAGGARVPVHR